MGEKTEKKGVGFLKGGFPLDVVLYKWKTWGPGTMRRKVGGKSTDRNGRFNSRSRGLVWLLSLFSM